MIRLSTAALLLAIFGAVAGAQEPKPAPSDDNVRVTVRSVDESAFPDITIDYEVRRADGSALLDAKQADFRVTESGRDVPIRAFIAPRSVDIRPTTVVLVLDHSGSMTGNMELLQRAVRRFLEALPPGSEIAVIAFNSDIRVISPFTANRVAVQEAVDALEPDGGTRFYDAVERALELLAGRKGRRAVLAMTDGWDTDSRLQGIETLVAKGRSIGVPVHTLGLEPKVPQGAFLMLTRAEREELSRRLADAPKQLERLAVDTRGRAFTSQQADQLGTIFQEIAESLRDSYSLTYRTDRKLPDGTLRPIEVYFGRATKAAGETVVFIRGMVVPAAGWPRLFLALVGCLVGLWLLPTRRRARASA